MVRLTVNSSIRSHGIHADGLWIDILKVVASQCIVWHHFVLYGPMANASIEAWPQAASMLADHGRMAVQIFLVVGGYLAAQSVERVLTEHHIHSWSCVLGMIAKRWQRLCYPYFWALIGAIITAWFARRWGLELDTPSEPDAWQTMAHLMLLQDWWGVSALSAGIWYISMDLQLYVCFLIGSVVVWHWPTWCKVSLMFITLAASLWVWNLDPTWETAPWYFWGSYGLGVAVQRAVNLCHPFQRKITFLTLVLLVVFALSLAWRERLLVAAMVAMSLWWAARMYPLQCVGGWSDRLKKLSSQSFALFLWHYPCSLIVVAAVMRLQNITAETVGWVLLLCWTTSMLVAAITTVLLSKKTSHTRWIRPTFNQT